MAKKNMSLTKVPMPEQAPDVRNKNFEEVALGYTAEMAMEEAARCLNCKNKPCVSGCPVNVPIPGFIEKVAEGDFEAAYEIITSENALPAICGRVCPPLFALWFMLWDEKKYRQSERRRHHDDPFYQESYYSSRHS